MTQDKRQEQSLLSKWKKSAAIKSVNSLEKRPEEKPRILSSGQKRLWLLQALNKENPFYNYAECYAISGPLDLDRFLQSYDLVAEKHEILRTIFSYKDEQLIQQLKKDEFYESFEINCERKTQVQIDQSILENARLNFDLENGPLVRFHFYKKEENKVILLISMHHIITDKWSMNNLRKEIADNYSKLQSGLKPNNDPLAIQYVDYAHWESKKQTNSAVTDYWSHQLKDAKEEVALPYDVITKSYDEYAGGFEQIKLTEGTSKKITIFCKENKITHYVFFLSIFKILLHKYSNQNDIIVGTPYASRDKKELEALIGFFNETIVLRNKVEPTDSFIELIQQVRKTVIDGFKYKDISFEYLVKHFSSLKDKTKNPLFNTMFLYHDVPANPKFSEDISFEYYPLDIGVSKFDLTLYVSNDKDVFTLIFEFSRKLFRASSVQNFLTSYNNLIDQVLADGNLSIHNISLLSEKETQQILKQSIAKKINSEQESVLESIEDNFVKYADAISLKDSEKEITYVTLDKASKAIAERLLEKTNSDSRFVGIYLDRKIEYVIAILGILRAGLAYVPLDPLYPEKRIQNILEDAAIGSIISTKNLYQDLDFFTGDLIDILEEENTSKQIRLPKIQAEDLAYVIYTSGSTGKPKGVKINHRNLLASNTARIEFYKNPVERYLLLSSFSFDSSVAGIFWTLMTGGALHISENKIEQEILKLGSVIQSGQVTHTLLIPTLYAMLLELVPQDNLVSLKNVIVAGEKCEVNLVNNHFDILENSKLYNEYGPTETTVWSSVIELKSTESNAAIPIGYPIPNSCSFILDKNLALSPIGVYGELHIAGDIVSTGYLHKEKLSSERFINVKIDNLTYRLYKTGDKAKWNQQGQLEFGGRIDKQVKINGYRIEPDEIARVIVDNQLAEKAVVLYSEKTRSLNAYTRNRNSNIELRAKLSELLPRYMLPKNIIELDEFPTLPNGKIDYKAFPLPIEKKEATEELPNNELTGTRSKLLKIWQEVLNIKNISTYDNYFDIGGDSISSIRIIAKARKENINLTARSIFDHGSIDRICLFLDDKGEKNEPTAEPMHIAKQNISATAIQHWFLQNFENAPNHWNQAIDISLKDSIALEKIQSAITNITSRHKILNSKYYQENGEWKIGFANDKINCVVEHHKIASDEEKKLIIQHAHKGLDLNTGKLFKCLFLESVENNYIILIVHHLVIDIVSWNTLIDDLDTELAKESTSNARALTTGYDVYADSLQSLVAKNYFDQQIEYWEEQDQAKFPSEFLLDSNIKSVQHKFVTKKTISNYDGINKDIILCKSINQIEVDQLLATAFLRAFNQLTNQKSLSISVEKHGRNVPDIEIEFDQTVGWFTSYFPQLLALSETNSIQDDLKKVKQQLNSIPDQGIGYGVLKYLSSKLENSAYPPVIFNYLGRANNQEYQNFYTVDYNFQDTRSTDSECYHFLEVNTRLSESGFTSNWSYNPEIISSEFIDQFLASFKYELEALIRYSSTNNIGLTPSDFKLSEIDQKNINELSLAYSNNKIEEIVDLNTTKQALLFHSKQDGRDQGLLTVEIDLEGTIEQDILQEAWKQTVQQYEILRSVIHTSERGETYQIYLKENNNSLSFISSDKSKIESSESSISLDKLPTNKLNVISVGEKSHRLTWHCHHIFLDGWSTAIILKTFIGTYNKLIDNAKQDKIDIPKVYDYDSWLQKKSYKEAQDFWANYFQGYNDHSRLLQSPATSSTKAIKTIRLSRDKKAFDSFLNKNRITLNTIMQAAWGITLSKLLDNNDVSFGTTVSGRSSEFPKIDELAGLFAKVIPCRIDIEQYKSNENWLSELQHNTLDALEYQYCELNDIFSWGEVNHLGQLFDSLLVIENFPAFHKDQKHLNISSFKSGITSTYPLTLVVINEKQLKLELRYEKNIFTSDDIEKIAATVDNTLILIMADKGSNEISSQIPLQKLDLIKIEERVIPQDEYRAPSNQIELELTKIWEKLLNTSPISTTSNFFSLGGKSLMAVQLFASIKEQYDLNLPPTLLLKNPTIEKLAAIISSGEISSWSSLVPLRASGNKPPLFCFHAAGGHVMFYNDMAEKINENIPIYGVQPKGMDGSKIEYNTINELANFYLEEIKSIQPEGPYHLLGTCFSNAVTFEIAKILLAQNEKIGNLFIIDSGPPLIIPRPKFNSVRLFAKWLSKGDIKSIRDAIKGKVVKKQPDWVLDDTTLQEKNLILVQERLKNLLKGYVWEPLPVKMILIRSSEYNNNKEKDFHITAWNKLAKKGLDTIVLDVAHYDVFKNATALENMAKEIEQRHSS